MKKRFTEEEIIGILREAERPGADVRGSARKLKLLEAENARLKKLAAEQLLAIDALEEFSRGMSKRSACTAGRRGSVGGVN